MAHPWFLVVVLVALLSTGNSVPNKYKKNQNKNIPTTMKTATKNNMPMDPQKLANLVKDILNSYEPTVNGNNIMFAVAVSIPYDQKTKKFKFADVRDNGATVRNKIEKCLVYTGQDVVAATVLKYANVDEQCPDSPVEWNKLLKGCPNDVRTWAQFKSNCAENVRIENLRKMKAVNGLVDHAEYRVLQHFDKLADRRSRNGLLLFYSHASPCDEKCTNPNFNYHILNAINAIKKWKNYAFVFSKPFNPKGKVNKQTLQKNVRMALSNLGNQINLSNIFRCDDKDDSGKFGCQSCSSNGQVSDICISG